jgi:hypothetical protein
MEQNAATKPMPYGRPAAGSGQVTRYPDRAALRRIGSYSFSVWSQRVSSTSSYQQVECRFDLLMGDAR